MAAKVGWIQPPPFMGINPDQNWIDVDDEMVTKALLLVSIAP